MDYREAASRFMEGMAGSPHKEPLNHMQRFSKGEMFAMITIQKTDGPLSAGDMATAMKTSSARIASILNSLESKGFIERIIDPSDRRKILVTMTKKGEESVIKAQNMMRDHLTSVFEEMGENDTLEFIRLTRLFFSLMDIRKERD